MKIIDFRNFISEFPFKNQSFEIRKERWNGTDQQITIDEIFEGKDTATINRDDLYKVGIDLEKFIVMTLMWGYPTKGRGKNINNILQKSHFEMLVEILLDYKCNDITIEKLKKDINSIPGLGLSTITKFTHFLRTTINEEKAVILDNQIIEAIRTGNFEEFNHLKIMTYDNAIRYYADYLKTINDLSISMAVKPDQIEIFLFAFGRNLSEIKTEINGLD